MSVEIAVDDRILVDLIRGVESDVNPTYIVADGVEYGIHQELGTSTMAGKHFLRGAVRSVRDWVLKKWDFHSLTLSDRIIRQAAFMVQGLASRDAPVETGALRGSIHVVKVTESTLMG